MRNFDIQNSIQNEMNIEQDTIQSQKILNTLETGKTDIVRNGNDTILLKYWLKSEYKFPLYMILKRVSRGTE